MKNQQYRFFNLIIACLLLCKLEIYAQDVNSKSNFQIELSTTANWNVVNEGEVLQLTLKTTGGKSDKVFFKSRQGLLPDMKFDSTGYFEWQPSFDIADRTNTSKTIQVIFEATNGNGETAIQSVDFKVNHVNRPPHIEELKPFYMQNRAQNNHQINMDELHDEDGDPLVIVPIIETLPEGAKLSSAGEFVWQPSQTQFNNLKNKPIFIEFWVEDQPTKARTKARIKLEATQMDLPPSITKIPKGDHYKLKENTTVNIKFYLSDPNGDDNIEAFDFITDNTDVPKSALIENTPNQYEFTWTPSYDFVKDPYDSLYFSITFFVMDKEQNREERKITFTVMNAINEVERDKQLYELYRAPLVEAWNLLTQLAEKEQELKKNYLRAKKGKKNRSMFNASMGAITGVSPAVFKVPEQRVMITAIGGTTIMTVGALEAAEVIGKPLKDLLDRYNYVLEKKIEIQNKGDVFAREYALKASRRQADFVKKRDEFKAALAIKGPVTLDLDAGWENKKEATDKAINHTFKDFTPLQK